MDTFTRQLRAHATDRPDADAVIFVTEPGAGTRLTYRELDDQARRLAAHLRADHPAGARMLLLYPAGTAFAVAFVACQYAQLVAVPAPAPNGQQHRRQRLASILRNSGGAAVLTEASTLDDVRDWAPGVPVVVTDRLDLPPTGWEPGEHDPGVVSFLQYTSGSTGSPRGTVITHRNVVAHAAKFARMLDAAGPVRVGGWLPMHHDMGLIGQLITPLGSGGTGVLMAPTAFLRRPVDWLRLIDDHDVWMSAAPNFAYELCTGRITDRQLDGVDLSRWQIAINGSEPVQARTVEAFTARFAAAGLRPETVCPGYGLAEATLAVSLSPRTEVPATSAGEHGRTLVGNGPVHDIDLRVVDPETGAVRPPGEIGEIWLRGPSVAAGYWQDAEATARTFGAATSGGETGFLRTGDLGALRDGQLYVTGRIKEVLIVHGHNLYPQDLEAEARLVHPALAGLPGAAFTVPVPQEEVVLVHEAKLGALATDARTELAEQIRLHLSRAFGVTASVLLVRPGAVRRTTSGKIQRTAMRRAFLDGDLEPVVTHLTTQAARRYAVPAAVVAG